MVLAKAPVIAMLIPVIDEPHMRVAMAINSYTFKPNIVRFMTNRDLGLETKHLSGLGIIKLQKFIEETDADIIIWHVADWRLLDNEGLGKIITAFDDPQVIHAGIRPWSKIKGQWHESRTGETVHYCAYVNATRREILPYLLKCKEAYGENAEILNEATFQATFQGWKCIAVDIPAFHLSEH